VSNTASWIAIIVIGIVGLLLFGNLDRKNQELQSALIDTQQRQNQLNDNFRSVAQETERILTRHEQELQSINSRIKTFQATKDPDSGAIIWDDVSAME
jgi:uncharacterized protein HemX